MKNKFSFVLVIFFIILLVIPLYLPFETNVAQESAVLKQGTAERTTSQTAPNLNLALRLIKEGERAEGFDILINLFTSTTFVQKFENLITDKVPFRMSSIRFSKAIDRAIIKSAYNFTDDTIIPADMTSGIYYDAEFDQLMFSPTVFDSNEKKAIDERIKNYEELIQKYPDQHFYLYYHQTLKNSEFHPLNQTINIADKGQSLNYFETHLPSGLNFGKLPLTSHSDNLKYYYRTDHHWTITAVIQAYNEIHKMLSVNYPDINSKLEFTELKSFPEINFLGYLARQTLYPVRGDEFVVEKITFPQHEIIESGQVIDNSRRSVYFEGNYSTVPYINHYNAFYGEVTDLIEYTFENQSDRNLLIIGSSFRNSLDPLLASHYKKTYCVDLRYYTDFSLSNFLSQHKIDDILIVGDNEVAFQDVEYWKINP